MRNKVIATAAGLLLGAGALAACGDAAEETQSCNEWTDSFLEDGTFTAADEPYADLGCTIIEEELPQYDTDEMTQQEYSDAFGEAAVWLDNQVPNEWDY